MVHYNNCPFCRSEEIRHYLQTSDHFLTKEPFEIYECTGCGTLFTQNHPEKGNSTRYYAADDYISHDDNAPGFVNSIYRISRKIMLRNKKTLVQRLTALKAGRLLDIGSGTGHFISAMKNAGWSVKGVEVNDKARDYSISRFGVDVISQEQISALPTSDFDCITLWHVLEHLHEPFKYVSEIQRLLKPEGICVAALPNCDSYDAHHYREFWAAWDVPRHLWHFNPASFRSFAESKGFTVIRMARMPLDVFYISVLSEKYKKSGFYLINGIIKGPFFACRALFNLSASSSLIYILKKKDQQQGF
ncbi:MAG: class I SAM-dependent methyltransferase [Bacteroidales bacterium]|nr:class I SAM-dependent methyltransferase [Bacteroidales bacterium]